MVTNKVFFVFFSVLLLFPLASNSEAKLWDLQIQASVENTPMNSGDRPIVSGVIVDHAAKPVHKASVNIRSGTMSIFTMTSETGEFNAELGKHARIPGIYTVNIVATTSDGKTGITSIQFQVKGELEQTTVNKEKLSTTEAKKYLEANPEDFEKNPLGLVLYNYYQKLYQEYLEDKKIVEKLTQEQAYIEEQKKVANELRLKAIEEFKPGYGIFSGPQYEDYVNSLDEEVKDTIVQHLNFTKNLYLEAHSLRSQILENGGTADEAQLAFLDKISISRNIMENFGETSDNSTETKLGESVELYNVTTSESLNLDTAEYPIQVNVDGVNVKVDYRESIFFVNINGAILEFLINGTQIIQVNSSK